MQVMAATATRWPASSGHRTEITTMPSITSWNRLEPRTRSPHLPGLTGRIHDPMWMLGRQWQLGEFLGEDAGSPISVRVRGESTNPTAYSGAGVVRTLAAGALLEPMAQSEAPQINTRERIASGLTFLRLMGASLRQTVQAWYAQSFPVDPIVHPDASSFEPASTSVRLMPDGAKLIDALQHGSSRLIPPGLSPQDEHVVRETLSTFGQWYASNYPTQSSGA